LPHRLAELESRLAQAAGALGGEPGVAVDAVSGVLAGMADGTAPDPQAGSLAQHREEIDAAFRGADSVEEIVARLEASGSEWAARTLKQLRRLSPTALKVTLRALRQGAALPLEQTFPVEYRLSQVRPPPINTTRHTMTKG
jgi:enoyl-CoA hydratase